MDSYPGCDLICDLESHSLDLICHLIRILFYDTVQTLPILIIDLYAQSRRDSILLKKNLGFTCVLVEKYV